MHAVIFVGLQAAGKSTFYRRQFFATHVRLSLDMLRTRHREARLMAACVETSQPFVVDNTNPTRADRARYVEAARGAGFRVTGYHFRSSFAECVARNQSRPEPARVPIIGLLSTAKRLVRPEPAEGFDELFCVRIAEGGDFEVEAWRDEA